MVNSNELSNKPILYELLEYFIRKQEPELIKCKNDTIILPTTGTIKNALRYLNNRYSLPESISQQISLTLPWKFAIGDHGRLLAILQENIIEIRKAKDEYSSIIGKASVPKDAFPQWRKLTWSPDGSLLVLASSNGYISFYNALGNNIFNINPKTISQNPNILEAGDSIASMIFLKPKTKSEKYSYEFLLITYSGLLRSYYILTINEFEANYEFSFGTFYKNGINAVTYDEKHNLFYVAGNTITQKLMSTASDSGLTSWRPLNEYPYCKLSFIFDDQSKTKSRFSIWNIIPTLNLQPESIIFKIKISPNSKFLTCLHTDGSISLWRLPTLFMQKKWKLSEQPDFNIPNPLGHARSKKFPPGVTEFHPIDIGWWSDEAIIIARCSGSTSVCSINNLKNLLGASPEFLAGQPQIYELCSDRGFLCLDCETYITSKKRNRESNTDCQTLEFPSESGEENGEDELEPISILNYTTSLIQSTLYSITDIEKFQPKKKKSKVLFRTYRILGLKSTTPEELYSRKIDIEEYEEALALANMYNLDTDLVYQTQWRKSELSLNAIQKHLSKVTKRSWVLHECITRVPDTIEAARELLNFGLKGANLETLLAIGTCDNGKFVIDNIDEDWNEMNEANVNLRQLQKINQILEKIDIKYLSEAQKDLIKYRRKLLDHLDKLLTYEIILNSSLKYDKNFYEEFRQFSAIENAIKFAKNGNCREVEIMFIYYGEYILPHWLAIINFFPETLNPLKYKKLLPECDINGQLFLLDRRELRQKDWVERTEFNEIINLENNDKSQLLYDYDPSLSVYRNTLLTPELLQNWYESRAYQIERNSCMVDNALQLIKIAKSHNITGLDNLLLDLETLDDLIYKVYLEDLSLDQLQKLSNLEKIKLLMSMTTEKTFVNDIKNFVLPFIKRRHQYLGGELQKHLFSDYLISTSKDNLKLSVKFFEYLKQSCDNEILQMIENIVTLALDCIYACNDPNMYETAICIVDSIAKDRDVKKTNTMNILLEELEKELECTKILNKYSVKTTLNSLQKIKNNPEAAKQLLIQMARSLNKRISPSDEKQWAQLLNEMLEIHSLIFTCIDTEICFEICVSARLVSGVKSNIQNCANLIETKKNEQSLLKVSYEKTVNLILDASKEYFNSSKSLIDFNMELAKTCLHLIEDDNAQIKEEYDLINSLQILNEFNINILPLQVRLMQDRLQLIKDCLNKREDAHRSRQRLLTLANYLRIERNNSRMREGKVLELIAKKALEVKDFNVCAATCQQLIQNNYISAWTVALELGFCEDYEDLKTRQKYLWFAINNGSNDILSKALDQIHLIEIQIIHKNLELWIPADSPSDDFNDADSEEEFIDALTTPQVETKEFVPKVLETSTEIVKTSANIMKGSTFNLIKIISDTNFWKSKLKFNFSNNQDNDTENENYINDDDVQSFPCFYEDLHKNCKISNFDTKYTNYSMPDIQITQLKCCRALLRITMLNESSCCGLEVSDINHLFLECAKYTIQQDWLLGMAYLFSVQKNYISEVHNILTEFPQIELYIQTLMYYYCLELYKTLHKNFENLYLYSPLSLMWKMMSVIHKCKESDIYESFKYLQTCFFKRYGIKNITFFEINQEIEDNSKVEDYKERDKFNISLSQNSNQSIEKLKEEKISTENLQYDNRLTRNVSESNDKNDVEWTDNWGNFSDEDVIENVANGKSTLNQKMYIENISLTKDIGECVTEKERFEAFEKIFNKIQNIDHFYEVKKLLLQWPKFEDSEYIKVDKHPILKMMKIVNIYIVEKEKNKHNKQIFEEYKELIKTLSSTNVLKEFLNMEEIPLEHAIYIRLDIDNSEFHEEAINILKEKHEEIILSAPILEMLFLKNLTATFDPNHEIFNRIIEHVFINRSLTNVKENAEILVQELKKKNQIAYALYIIKLMEDIPPSLCTFSTCFELLMRK